MKGGALREFGRTVLVIAIGLAIGSILVLIVSNEPLNVFQAILTGPLPSLKPMDDGSWAWRGMTRFGTFLEDSITLTLVGLAVTIPFRAKQFSLGADGQLFLGALVSGIVSIYVPLPGLVLLPLAFLSAALAGFFWGWLAGVMKARAGANEIVTTLMLNVIAIQTFGYVVLNVIRDPNESFIVSYPFQEAALLHPILAKTHVSILLFVVPILCLGAHVLMRRMTLGYEIRTVGENPAFARQMGLPVNRAIALSMAIGGALAGLAGFHVGNAILTRLPTEFPAGLGFEGIVVALLARNDPRLVLPAALFYGYLRAGAQVMEATTDVSREMVLVVQAVIILLIVSKNLLPRLSGLVGLQRRPA